jgi:NTP pyrophosphatase (non-canonical NTP hydrolase)
MEKLAEKIEVVAAKYVEKYGFERDDDWYVFKLQEELGELTQKFLMMSGRARDKGLTREQIREEFADEVADTFCLTVLLAAHFDIDIVDAVSNKWFRYLDD